MTNFFSYQNFVLRKSCLSSILKIFNCQESLDCSFPKRAMERSSATNRQLRCLVDQIAYCPRLPLPGETILGEKYETGLGGKGANQAAQAALLSSPGEVVLFGAVGNDKNGIWYLEELAKTGVDCSKIKTKESSTGVAPITVSMENGENSIVVVPGANMLFTEEDLDEKSFEGIKIVVCQNEIPVCTTRKALELGKLSGAQTIYSPAPCPKREDFATFCKKIDFLIANDDQFFDQFYLIFTKLQKLFFSECQSRSSLLAV
ncbi:unnamed protein product [Oikopleura dioica]|uniref:Carbohydrate kinase PfkB domain-containing protein n=1 Tax=Oikopleura dioica TaxID=34765 RepID=E4Y068_OIKDI|nr:unnamed protein product [Oikopleura dioica]